MLKIIKFVAIGAVTILAILLILYIVTPFLLLLNEGAIVKNDFDNQYINSDYQGWIAVESEEFPRYMIPDSWSATCDDGGCTTYLKDGKPVAMSSVFECGDEDRWDEFFSAVAGAPVTNTETEYPPEIGLVGGCTFCKVTVETEQTQREYYCLDASTTDSRLLLVFLDHTDYEYEDIVEIVEAIIWSYAYYPWPEAS